jgi:amino acid adenylation domain-containing protein/thioester reductase-like protein
MGHQQLPYHETVDHHEPFPLSEIQSAYYVGRSQRYELGGVSCHYYTELEAKLDIERLNHCWRRVIDRHPMLRAIIRPDGRQQVLAEVPEYTIEVVDISGLDGTARQQQILDERARMSHDLFRADRWPLFEIKAFRLSDDRVYLLLSFDFLIADARSIEIITGELLQLYESPEAPLPELHSTFRQYIEAHYRGKGSPAYQRDRQLWLSRLESFPLAPALPLTDAPSAIGTPRFRRLCKYFNQAYWQVLKTRCRARDIRPSVVFCTAFAEVLSFWSNQSHFAINFTVSNRDRSKVGDIVGDFTSVMLIEINLEPGTSFWERAQRIQETVTTALAHRSYEGVEMIRELSRFNDLGNRAAMPVVITSLMSGDYQEGWSRLGEIRYGITQTPQVFLDNQAARSADGLTMRWDYVEQLFDEEVIAQMFEQYIALLESAIEEDGRQLQISDRDRELIERYNLTYQDIRPTTLDRLFADQVARTPEAVAVTLGSCSMTYGELDDWSNRVAAHLLAQGVAPGDRLGILAARDIRSIVNILGVLKAGAVYVPVSPDHPPERRQYMFGNSGCRLVLEPDASDDLPSDVAAPPHVRSPDDIAYIIYTSGSTGWPKGVVISHGAASNTILDINQRFVVGPEDRIIGISSLCFDLSVYDIFGALSTGATLVMVPDQRDVAGIARIVKESKITIWNTVPAIMELCLEAAAEGFRDSLRLALLSGDWIPLHLAERIRESYPKVELVSLGGATEGSIWSIYYPINEIDPSWASVPYGFPLANQRFYVLNYEDQLCPVGVQGELCVGGRGVALGYDSDPESSRRSFIRHPQLGYLYKTGDYGVLHREGQIEFIGRKDRQVKINGYRIELDEIQNRLLAHRDIRKAVVRSAKQGKDKQRLCAYLVADYELDADELRSYLLQELPEYMVPSSLVQIDDIPLTANGKIDIKALPEPQEGPVPLTATVPPRNEREQIIAEEWKKVLQLERIGVTESFFDLGGDSLQAIELVSRLAAHFDVSSSQVFENLTIEELAEQLSFRSDSLKEKAETLEQRQQSYLLHAENRTAQSAWQTYCRRSQDEAPADLESRQSFRNVLVSGATGYLGSYIVRDLLAGSDCRLWLPVRGSSSEEAMSRLGQSLAWYFGSGFVRAHRDRLTVLAADLAEDRIGLSTDDYEMLADEVDCVINAAANVKHFGLYDDFHGINTGGTARLIQLCRDGRAKELHHISTTRLALFNADSAGVVFSEYDIDVSQSYGTAYQTTKLEAEKLISEARDDGLAASIYRVGALVFDSTSGLFQRNIEDNGLYRNLRSYIRLGTLPDSGLGELDFSFVDQASRAILLLLGRSGLRNRVHHIYNPHTCHLTDLAAMLRSAGIELEVMPFASFFTHLQQTLEAEGWHAAAGDLLFSYGIYEEISNLPQLVSDRTQAILRQLGFEWPQLEEAHIKQMIRHCREVGFLE